MDWFKPPVGRKLKDGEFWTDVRNLSNRIFNELKNKFESAFQPQSCTEERHVGFRAVTGREHDFMWWGIVNAKTQCVDSTIEDLAGNMMYGGWNQQLNCESNQRFLGFQVMQDLVYDKLVNFRAQCGTIQ